MVYPYSTIKAERCAFTLGIKQYLSKKCWNTGIQFFFSNDFFSNLKIKMIKPKEFKN